MARRIGIDLGTTYTATAIAEQRQGPGFLTVPDCPGYSVILDRLKRRTTPSVVAENEKGEIVVGHGAKGRAGLSPAPIMFSKRYMGEEKLYPLNQQSARRPEEAAADILRHIKQLAETQLGETVDEAVITVPAIFKLSAKQLTEKAGEMAGLKVTQLALEPVAAALAYFAQEPPGPKRVMTYDLGGGTFDIAILETQDGTFSSRSVLSFDGDRFLGGYDFDRTLACWMIDELNAQGYQLSMDDETTLAKLLIYAERAKIELSQVESCEIQEINTGITDQTGNPVVIELGITRQEFEEMISPQIEHTMDICRRAMSEERADQTIRPEEIDEIIMVGGSTRIPLIHRRLEEEFGIKPCLVEPDLCVALGAAILARTHGERKANLRLGSVPRLTELTSIAVTGNVVPEEDLASAEGCTVRLRSADGSYDATRTTGANGSFTFDNVQLAEEAETQFILSVASPDGTEVAEHRFSVKHSEAGLQEADGPTSIPNVLSKPIFIEMVTGLHEVAPVRTALPFETIVEAKTSDQSGTIRIPILEGSNALGEIRTTDIPTTLPVGSDIDINVNIQDNYQIVATALVRALSRTERVVIDIPIPPQKTRDELRSEVEQAEIEAEDALNSAPIGNKLAGGKAQRLQRYLEQCRQMLDHPNADVAAIQDRLEEVQQLIRELRSGWKPEPSRDEYERKAAEASALLEAVIAKRPEVEKDGYDKRLEAISCEADEAYSRQDQAAWRGSVQKMNQLTEDLTRLGVPPGPPPDPHVLLIQCSQELSELQYQAELEGKYALLEPEFREAADLLGRIDGTAPDALMRIYDWYRTRLMPLRDKLRNPPNDKGLPILR